MGQINPFSAYGTDPVQLDRHLIGDREGQPPRRQPKQKPRPQAEDEVELHGGDEVESPAQPTTPPSGNADDSGHLDITA